jgi:multiple sugar transport system substrate-binding protein
VPAPAAGVTVRVAAAAGPPRLLIERLGRAWASGAGAKLEVSEPIGEWPTTDLVLIPAPELPRWAAAGKATPLPRQDAIDAFMPLYRNRLLTWDRTAYAEPVLGDAPLFIFRRDLFADAAARQSYQEKFKRSLEPPRTWEEFADQADFFATHRARPSLPPLPADDAGACAALESVASSFAVRALSTAADKSGAARTAKPFSFQYDVDTGEPRIAGPAFVEALALLKRMQPRRAAAATPAEAMRSDQVALAAVRLVDLAGLGPEEGRRWGVFRGPGSLRVEGAPVNGPVNVVPLLGAGAVLGVVPAGAAQPAAAFELLNFLSGPAASAEVVHTPPFGSGPFRDVHLDPQHELGWLNYGLDDKETANLRAILREVADPRIDNPAIDLRIPGRPGHVAALANAVRTAVQGGDPATVLNAAADQWKKLDGDAAKARAEYRRSMGLQP